MKKTILLKVLLFISLLFNLVIIYSNRKTIIGFVRKNFSNQIVKNSERVFYYSFTIASEQFENGNDSKGTTIGDSLIVPPNNYTFEGKNYSLLKEGLYRFFGAKGEVRHAIVYDSNLYSLVSSICWIVTHGNADNKLKKHERKPKAVNGKLFLTCSRIVEFAKEILESNGYKSRTIYTYSTKALNGYDDEHVMLEVFDPKLGKWVLFDLDNNVYFEFQGKKLSLMEYKELLDSSIQVKLKRLSADARVDVSNFKVNNADIGLISENILGDSNLIAWHKRIMSVVSTGSRFYQADEIPFMKKHKPNILYLPKDQFYGRFYKKLN